MNGSVKRGWEWVSTLKKVEKCLTCEWGKRKENRRRFDFLTGAISRRLSIEQEAGLRQVRPSWSTLLAHFKSELGYPYKRDALRFHVEHVRTGKERM